MGVSIKKEQALRFFCLARQAERSIDFALSSERQWDMLRQYYHGERLGMLECAVESLRGLTPPAAPPISRDQAFRLRLGWVLTYPARRLLNRLRASWRFEEKELQFILQTFRSVIDTLRRSQKPEARTLVQIRMDLYACQVIIERKLVGLPQARQAQRIEHFCQAAHIRPFKLEEISAGGRVKARRISA
jgi:hypothetical protein